MNASLLCPGDSSKHSQVVLINRLSSWRMFKVIQLYFYLLKLKKKTVGVLDFDILNFRQPKCPKEKAMAPHSSILAWKIPWTEEPGRLQTMRSLRV